MYGRRIPRAEMFARIDAVTPAVVNAVAHRFIRDRDVVVTAMGPTQFLPARARAGPFLASPPLPRRPAPATAMVGAALPLWSGRRCRSRTPVRRPF